MAAIETTISNMSLGRIGVARLNDYATDESVPAQHCRLHYEQVRKSLLRSFEWNFTKLRVTLSKDTVAPDHEWDYQYFLPTDYIRLIKVYDADINSYDLEGNKILTDEDTVEIKYVADITDPAAFDELFTEIFILQLALKLLPALAGAGNAAQSLMKEIRAELVWLMRGARVINRQEANVSGKATWNEERL